VEGGGEDGAADEQPKGRDTLPVHASFASSQVVDERL